MALTRIRQSNITQPLDADLDTLSLSANGNITATGDLTVGGNTAITGTVTTDALNVTGDALFDSANAKVEIKSFLPRLIFNDDSAVGAESDKFIIQSVASQSNGDYAFVRNNDQTGSTDVTLAKFSGNGDIGFYDSDGNNQSFFWDATEKRLGLLTTNPRSDIHIFHSSNTAYDDSANNYGQGAFAEVDAPTIFLDNTDNTLETFGHIVWRHGNSGQAFSRIASRRTGAGSSAMSFMVANSGNPSYPVELTPAFTYINNDVIIGENSSADVLIGGANAGTSSNLRIGKAFDGQSAIKFVRNDFSLYEDFSIRVDASENTHITYNGSGNINGATMTIRQGADSDPVMTFESDRDVTVHNNLSIAGDLTVSGTTTTINTNNLEVEDSVIVLNKGSGVASGGTALDDIGIIFNRYNTANTATSEYNVALMWDESQETFKFVKTDEEGTDASLTHIDNEWVGVNWNNSDAQAASPVANYGRLYTPWVMTAGIEARTEGGAASTGISMGADGATNSANTVADEIVMWANGFDMLTVNGSGVGIGPSRLTNERLHIADTSGEARIRFDNSNSIRNNYIGITASDNIVIAADESDDGTGSEIKLRVDNTEKLIIGGEDGPNESTILTRNIREFTTGASVLASGMNVGGVLLHETWPNGIDGASADGDFITGDLGEWETDQGPGAGSYIVLNTTAPIDGYAGGADRTGVEIRGETQLISPVIDLSNYRVLDLEGVVDDGYPHRQQRVFISFNYISYSVDSPSTEFTQLWAKRGDGDTFELIWQEAPDDAARDDGYTQLNVGTVDITRYCTLTTQFKFVMNATTSASDHFKIYDVVIHEGSVPLRLGNSIDYPTRTVYDRPIVMDGNFAGQGLIIDSSSGAGLHLKRGSTSNEASLEYYTGDTLNWIVGMDNTPANANTSFTIKRVENGSQQDFHIDHATGYVGINVDGYLPNYQLDVNGSLSIGDTSSAYSSMLFEPKDTADTGYNGSIYVRPRTIPGSGTADWKTRFYTPSNENNGNTRHDVEVDGRVRIGRANSDTVISSQLEVWGGTSYFETPTDTTPAVLIECSDDGGAQGALTLRAAFDRDIGIKFVNDVTNNDIKLFLDGAADDSLCVSTTDGTTQLRIRQQGDSAFTGKLSVGGAAAPEGTLHVKDSSGPTLIMDHVGATGWSEANMKIIFDAASGSGGFIGSDGGESKFKMGTSSAFSAPLVFQTQEADRITILSTGEVGIGLASPDARLHVKEDTGSGNELVILESTDVVAASGAVLKVSASGRGSSSVDIDVFSVHTSGGKHFTVRNNGDVGIGVDSPSHKLEVNGSFAATTKSFDIEHPTKEGMRLHHGSLEGPEHGVYVRGRLTNSNIIELPDYWEGLVNLDSITVQLTSIGGKQDLWVSEIVGTTVMVGSEGPANCFYFVQAERKDVDKFTVEYEG